MGRWRSTWVAAASPWLVGWLAAVALTSIATLGCGSREDASAPAQRLNTEAFMVESGDGARLEVPVGAVPQGTALTIRQLRKAVAPGLFAPVGPGYEVQPAGLVFRERPTLVLPYDPRRLTPASSTAEVEIFTAPENGEAWESLATSPDGAKVSAELRHLSIFQTGTKLDSGVLAALETCLDGLEAVIRALPDGVFDAKPEQRRTALLRKLGVLRKQLGKGGTYEGFASKLRDDVLAKADGQLGGDASDDWVVTLDAQQQIAAAADCILEGDLDSDGLSFEDEVYVYGTHPFVADTDADGLDDGDELAYWTSRTDGVSWDSDLEPRQGPVGTSGDGLYNLIDPDSDDDGLLDGTEVNGWEITIEGAEVHVSADPAKGDTDGDGVTDRHEHDGWTLYVLDIERFVRSDPGAVDTDGDTLSDWREQIVGSDPARARSFAPHYTDASRADHIDAMDVATGIECPAILKGVEEATKVTALREKFADAGVTFIYEFHFYQPDSNDETINIEVASVDDNDAVDTTNSFSGIKLTQHPTKDPNAQALDPDFAEIDIAGAPGIVSHDHSPSKQGWYMVQLFYQINTGNRAIRFRVRDASGNALPIYWIDGPPLTQVDITLDVEVDPPGHYAYYKGGAYRNTQPGEFSYITDVAVDGNLLYKRAFDQGKYSFPLGFLSGGQHTLTARWESSGGFPTKLWESVCEHSFDPLDQKKAWDPLQILYLGNLHTRDYDAWSEGVAFRQVGSRPVPVRRGGTFSLALEDPSLASGDANLRIFPAGGSQVSWPAAKIEDYIGGYYVAGAYQPRAREHWQVTVPLDAPVGQYLVRAQDASGTQIGPIADLYVIFDPYPLVDGVGFTKQDLETWAYDEDEDGKQWDGYGPDTDRDRDDHAGWFNDFGWQNQFWMRAVRRDPPTASVSLLDIAASAVRGSPDEVEALRRLFRLTNQAIYWDGCLCYADAGEVVTDIPRTDARAVALGAQEIPLSQKKRGECSTFANTLTALARSVGIPARPASAYPAGWFNYHVWTEVRLPSGILPLHGGTSLPSGGAPADTDQWQVFDAMWPRGFDPAPGYWTLPMPAISPRVGYARAIGEVGGAVGDVVVTPLDWDTSKTQQVQPTASVSAGYAAGTEFWISSSSVLGWLGWGGRDIYMLQADAPRTVEVVAPAVLDVRLCAFENPSFGPSNLMPDCRPGTTSVAVTPGTWEIVVFALAPEAEANYGNTLQYELRVQ